MKKGVEVYVMRNVMRRRKRSERSEENGEAGKVVEKNIEEKRSTLSCVIVLLT